MAKLPMGNKTSTNGLNLTCFHDLHNEKLEPNWVTIVASAFFFQDFFSFEKRN
jgi:hypothetical protein